MTPFTPDELLALAHPISESMYLGIKQIIAERDEARALLKRAFTYVVNADVRFEQPEKLVSDIEAALPTVWDRRGNDAK